MLARRLQNIEESGIRKIFSRIQSVKDPIDLSIGQPHFDVPPEVKQAAIAAIEEGANRYTPTSGMPELRRRISAELLRKHGVRTDSILVTSGAAGGLTLAVLALLNEGDGALIPDPYFIVYKNVVSAVGGVPQFIDTYPDFKLTPARIRAAVTPATRMLFLNNPNNPTGAAYTGAELRAIAAEAERHGLWIVSDEIYEAFCYDFPFESMLKFSERCILVTAFSKTYGMPGWRVGYAAAPREVCDAMQVLSQFSYVCAPTPFQKACIRALDLDVSGITKEYRAKRDFVVGALRERFEIAVPGGAFYVFPRVPWGTDEEFIEAAIAERLLVVPGNACSRRHTHFRVSYAAADGVLEKGVEVLNRLAARGAR
ncbi:MAG: aminotransferase class I/II-fold pyridoxal phosphate-dependent enzyme [Planctomycetes bacterium]|nr:aminotransferase class I/II-fold pyridoxal phosphate-dependent enzyme [Planctomycetota bacterium]